MTALLLVSVLGMVAMPVAAHDYQTTVESGEYELGLSSTPTHPVAGVQTTFVSSISGPNGAVTNESVMIMITAPDGSMTHLMAHIPADNPHFHFSHTFLQEGVYEISLTTTLDGEKVTFKTHHEVSLIPTNPEGAQMAQLSQSVETIQNSVTTLKWIAGAAAVFALLALVGAVVAVSKIE